MRPIALFSFAARSKENLRAFWKRVIANLSSGNGSKLTPRLLRPAGGYNLQRSCI